jgi:hypothetical protein
MTNCSGEPCYANILDNYISENESLRMPAVCNTHALQLFAFVFAANSQPPVLHVDCLALDWQAGRASPGPWSLRWARLQCVAAAGTAGSHAVLLHRTSHTS